MTRIADQLPQLTAVVRVNAISGKEGHGMHQGPNVNCRIGLEGGMYLSFLRLLSSRGSIHRFSDVFGSWHVSERSGRLQAVLILHPSWRSARCDPSGYDVVVVVRPCEHEGAIARAVPLARPVFTTAFSPGFEGPILAT